LYSGACEVQLSIEFQKNSVAELVGEIPRSSFPDDNEESVTMQREAPGPLDGFKQMLYNDLSPASYFLILPCINIGKIYEMND
jgi:hypothetical protein